jgi:hypothetical protein
MAYEMIYVECKDSLVVPVLIEYVQWVDKSYGEDQDGRRGTVLTGREILDCSIDADHLKMLNVGDAEFCLDEARHIFENRITR